MTVQVSEMIAVLASTLFTGAAIYITAVEHPARLSCGTEIAATEWAPSYKRATLMQAPLAAIAGVFGIIRGLEGGSALWFWAALLIVAVIPFTLIVIRPDEESTARAATRPGVERNPRAPERVGTPARRTQRAQRGRLDSVRLGSRALIGQ